MGNWSAEDSMCQHGYLMKTGNLTMGHWKYD
jgi:hypothetical protein